MANGSRNGKAKQQEWAPLRDNREDRAHTEAVPLTAQSASPSYRLAYADDDFLCRRELRPVRLQLELLKAGMILDEAGIRSTVVLFGGAAHPRARPSGLGGKERDAAAEPRAASVYYDEARKFARLCSQYSAEYEHREFVVVTGGGPGVMEAGNRGAHDVHAPSIGLNIVLPHEQAPNPYVTPELSLNFHYFAIRKMHFIMRAKAVAVFPGGFGTMDELFETLTLIQTGRMERIPLILFGEKFWRTMVNFDALADFGTIAPEDLKLLNFVDTADEAWAIIERHYRPSGNGGA